jgi:hypothetical protein
MTKPKLSKGFHAKGHGFSLRYPLRRTLSSASVVEKTGKLVKPLPRKFFLRYKITLEPFRAIVKAQRTWWVCEGRNSITVCVPRVNIDHLSDIYRFWVFDEFTSH